MELAGFQITDVLQQAWHIKFPAVDLAREYPLMILWITKNPARQIKSPIRFIENWLRKVQKQSARDLAEVSKRGAVTAKRIGEKLKVEPHPGESQEAYNRRVIAACAGTIGLRVAR